MNRYPSYKPSGVQWLGEIPSHWEVCRFKNLVSLVTTPSNDSNKIGLENIESGSGKFIQTDNEFEGNGVHFQVNDVVYGKLRPYLQKVWLATFSGNAVGDFFVFRVNNRVVEKYLQYLMLSRCFTDDVNASTYGAKMPRVSSEYILTMRCAVPSKDEQIKIVSYLDAVTAKLDAAIAQQQRMIALLNERKQIIINQAVTGNLQCTMNNEQCKMKDSGVEWIGEVPEHWEVRKLKYLMQQVTTPSTSLNKIGLENIESGTGKFVVTDSEYEGNGIQFEKGDILYGKLRPYLKKVFVAEESGNAVGDFFVFRPNSTIDGAYMQIVLLSQTLTDVINSSTYGAKMPRVSIDFMEGLYIPCPPLYEQKAMALNINNMCKPIDDAIHNCQNQISLLQERKQIIINEVVTGKVKVA